MGLATDLDQAPEGNVLCALNFKEVLNPSHALSRLLRNSQASQSVLNWMHRHQDTFNRYPSIREPFVAALRGTITSVPPLSPAASPRLEDDRDQASSPCIAERTSQHEPLHGTGRDGSGQRSVPHTSVPIDKVEGDGMPDNPVGSQHQLRKSVCASETGHEATPTSTQSEHDQASTPTPVQAGPEQVGDYREGVEQIGVGDGREVGVEQPGHDGGQEELIKRDFDALRAVGGSQDDLTPRDVLSPASPSREPQPATGRPTLKRKRQAASPTKPQTLKRQRRSKGSLDADQLLADVTQRVHDIVTFDDIVFLWERLQLLSSSCPHSGQRSVPQDASRSRPSLQTPSRRQRLEKLWSCIGDSENMERWATVLQRICHAKFFAQYLDERTRWKEWIVQRRDKADRRAPLDDAEHPSHPLAEYVGLCFPKEIEGDREKAKKRFENLVQTKEPWVKLDQRFGEGISVFTSRTIRDEHVRKLEKAQLEPLVDHIDALIPNLEDHLRSLSELLSFFIEHGRLPSFKLRLESLSKDQLESMRSTEWSLRELLEPDGLREGETPDPDSQIQNGSVTNNCLWPGDWCVSSSPEPALFAQPTSQAPASLSPLPSSGSSANAHMAPSAQDYTSVTCSEFCTPIMEFLVPGFDFGSFLNGDNATPPLYSSDAPTPLNEDGCPTPPNEGDPAPLSNTDKSFLGSPLEETDLETLFGQL